jgi:hypothetical protein
MLWRLQLGGVRVEVARAGFQAAGRTYPKGTYVIRTAQPFRAYMVDLMEPQKYPEIRAGQSGRTKRPYDVAGWTLPFNMGVQVDRIADRFQAELEPAGTLRPPSGSKNHRENASYLSLARLLREKKRVRWGPLGEVLVEGEASPEDFAKGRFDLVEPRVGLYEPYTANMDAGWTQYLLEAYKAPHSMLKNADVRAGGLRERFDAIVLASQKPEEVLFGHREGERPRDVSRHYEATPQRPEFTGGIGLEGVAKLEEFVREGGTLVAFDRATDVPVRYFPLPVRPLLETRDDPPPGEGYWCPGSLLRIEVEPSHPVAFGMPKDAIAFSSGGQAWEVTLLPEFSRSDREVNVVARYATKNLLASGWISGAQAVEGKPILLEVRHGKGRVILFGFRPQFRAQSAGTFKFVLNAIYLAAARPI